MMRNVLSVSGFSNMTIDEAKKIYGRSIKSVEANEHSIRLGLSGGCSILFETGHDGAGLLVSIESDSES